MPVCKVVTTRACDRSNRRKCNVYTLFPK